MEQYVKRSTIDPELEWYEKKMIEYQAYIDSIDLSKLVDRIEWKPTARGGTMPMVIASREAQAKSFGDNMEKLAKLMGIVDDLRNKYNEKEFVGRANVKTKNTGMDFSKKMRES